MSTAVPLITLTSDFGTSDHYVAQMKGVILSIAPNVQIVDVSHDIPPQDVRRAACQLADLADAFPIGAIHVAVVDPGVGSDRAILAVAAGGQTYVAPDNGLLTLVLERESDARVVSVEDPRFRRSPVSATFHGRDIMAPAAAHLANGLPMADLGPSFSSAPVRLPNLTPKPVAGHIEASIAWIDRFGNLVTNVTAQMVTSIAPQRVKVKLGSHEIIGLSRFYAEVPDGEPALLIDSSGRLEVAVRNGSAAKRFTATAGTTIFVSDCE